MINVDVDSNPTTFNSSSADLLAPHPVRPSSSRACTGAPIPPMQPGSWSDSPRPRVAATSP
jgi:hypothetical protein